MVFELFDPALDVRITAGKLPHWYQPGVTYFVTYRTDDSFPPQVADLWYRRRNDWLQRNGIDPTRPHWRAGLRGLPEPRQHEFHNLFSEEFFEHLDRGHGACVLKRSELAAIIADNLHHFDGERYKLGDLAIVANHVHLLVCLFGATDIEQQCSSWKRYSATKINQALGRRGRFWHEESFDHLVRSPEHFDHFRRYIADNPKKANLRPGEYLHWHRRDPSDTIM